MKTGEVLANLSKDTKDLHDKLSLPLIRKKGEYYLHAGESGGRPPAPPWQAQVEAAKKIAQPALVGKFEIASAVQAGKIDGAVTVVHEDGATFVATKLATSPAEKDRPAIPLDAVCGATGHLAVTGVAVAA